jgi:D-alanyl-D-alanine carboxypeptidase/D-alanyl-D-alanine-endopeptidase (penicillin-binding protein 4)
MTRVSVGGRRETCAAVTSPPARFVRLLAALALAAIAIGTLVATPATAGVDTLAPRARPAWVAKIESLIGARPVSVAVGSDAEFWFRHLAWVRRPPASNEKLLLSMSLLRRFGSGRTIPTHAMAASPVNRRGIIRRNLWLVGRGDPETDSSDLARLADQLADDGLRRIRGRVMAAMGPFHRDWWATGWRSYFPTWYIPRPTALTYRGNEDNLGRNIPDPELRAAIAFTKKLRTAGIRVNDAPRTGSAPPGLASVARVRSRPLESMVRRMNIYSRNFYAEVLGKYLGAHAYGKGSIPTGARAIRAFASAHDVQVHSYDSSGLSYSNRITASGIVRLLWTADRHPWGPTLRSTLAGGGQGTLEDRLKDVRLRAKTGTLEDVSALSGWVWLDRAGEWAEFSIMSSGMPTWASKTIENRIVRTIAVNATDPSP